MNERTAAQSPKPSVVAPLQSCNEILCAWHHAHPYNSWNAAFLPCTVSWKKPLPARSTDTWKLVTSWMPWLTSFISTQASFLPLYSRGLVFSLPLPLSPKLLEGLKWLDPLVHENLPCATRFQPARPIGVWASYLPTITPEKPAYLSPLPPTQEIGPFPSPPPQWLSLCPHA